jgi:sigma-54 dependent transcriptional regulator, acetoin dehydrogenase operon transcriptional activator AcoR
VSLARLRYFEEGIAPTGVVTEAVFQSWARCQRSRKNSHDKIEFQQVSQSRSHLALQKNRVLHEAWLGESAAIVSALGFANCSAILTDASGVLIGATASNSNYQKIMPIAHRVGINLSEEHVGTTAPGIVARTGKQTCVLGAEHFYESVKAMYCTAAPIRNIHGHLAGILNFSSEGAAFQFDPSAVVGLYAASIENRFLIAQSSEHLIIKFQFLPSLINTPMVGMLGFDLAGKLVWLNSVASKLLTIEVVPDLDHPHCIESIFEAGFGQLASLTEKPSVSLRLRSGVQIFLTSELHTQASVAKPTNLSFIAPPADQTPDTRVQVNYTVSASTLRQADVELIQTSLRKANGNISTVAKELKVSRGLIYRRLQQLDIDSENCSKTEQKRLG